MFNTTIREAGRLEAKNIIANKKPFGKYWIFDVATSVYIGIDNSKGEAWTEEFDTKDECLKWLEDGK